MAKLLWWEFENSLADSSGNGLVGTIVGTDSAPSYGLETGSTTKYGKNLLSNATPANSPYVKTSSVTTLTPTRFTLKWKGTPVSNAGVAIQGLVCCTVQVSGAQGYFLCIEGGVFKVYLSVGAGWQTVTGTTAVVYGTKYTVHAVFNETDIRLYVNGAAEGAPAAAATYNKGVNSFYVGNYSSYLSRSNANHGHVWLDDTAFSAAEVLTDYTTDDANFGAAAMTAPLPSAKVTIPQMSATAPLPIASAGGYWCDYAKMTAAMPTVFAYAEQIGTRGSMLAPLPSASVKVLEWLTATLTAPMPTISAYCLNGTKGDLVGATMPSFTIVGSEAGKLWNATMPRFTMAGAQALVYYGSLVGGKMGFSGEGLEAGKLWDGKVPAFTMAGEGLQGSIGNLVGAVVPVFSLGTVVCYTSSTGNLVGAIMPAFTMAGRPVVVIVGASGNIEAIAICPTTGANTEYTNFKFNSFCVINGKVYGASDSGLFLLGGDNDAGTNITAYIETVADDFGIENLKSMPEQIISLKGGAATICHSWRNDYTPIQTILATDEMMSKCIKPGQGVIQRYWATKLSNVAGSVIEKVDTIGYNFDVHRRKVRQK